jgi:hypothetical protein
MPLAAPAQRVWSRSETIGLADASCSLCHGYGMQPVAPGREEVCPCVWRTIFRICLRRYQECRTHPGYVRRSRKYQFSRPTEEYLADFERATSNLSAAEAIVLRDHFLGKMPWFACARNLGMPRGAFFHFVNRLRTELGQRIATTAPYAIYPFAEYVQCN